MEPDPRGTLCRELCTRALLCDRRVSILRVVVNGRHCDANPFDPVPRQGKRPDPALTLVLNGDLDGLLCFAAVDVDDPELIDGRGIGADQTLVVPSHAFAIDIDLTDKVYLPAQPGAAS